MISISTHFNTGAQYGLPWIGLNSKETSFCDDSIICLVRILHVLIIYSQKNISDENNFSQDWEAVPHASPLEAALPPPIHSPHYHQHQASMAGGLMTSAAHSIASIWRGWTTGR